MQNNLTAPASGAKLGLASRLTPEQIQHYGLLTAELLDMGDLKMWRGSLINVLGGYLRACFDGEHTGHYSESCDIIELVQFFDRIEEVNQEFMSAKAGKP